MKIQSYFSVVSCLTLLTISNGAVTAFTIGSSRSAAKKQQRYNQRQQHSIITLITNADQSTDDPSSLSMTASVMGIGSSQFPPLKQSPPRKICLMVEPTPFTHISGYANRFNEMLKFLSKAGDHVKVMTVDQQTPKDNRPKDKFGYPVEHTHGFTVPLYNHIALSLDLQLKGRKLLKSFMPHKPDLIHVSSPGLMVIPAMIYARLMHIPLVMSYHTHLPMYAEKYLGFIPGIVWASWACLRWGHSKADLTLVTSPQMRNQLEEHKIPRVDVWRKGVDSERFNPKFRDDETRYKMTDGNPDDFLLLSVGRIGAEKRLKELKDILERMGKNVRLCIVGKGPQLKYLRKYFAGTNTVFTGQLEGDELSKHFASADAFVMPSDTETLGFVVMESMASSVPVVGANAGGVPDMIDNDNTGFLVPTGDIDAFVDRLQLLKSNPQRRITMGEAARKYAMKYKWEDATSILRNIQYEKALNNFEELRGKNRNDLAVGSRLFGRKSSSQKNDIDELALATV